VLNLALPILAPALDIGKILISHPSLVQEVGGHALAHVLYSYARRAGYSRRRNRRHVRKTINRRRRRFVDNIIMHHKRLHDKNRELVVTNARSRVLAKREAEKKRTALLQRTPQKDGQRKWRDSAPMRDRALEIRNRVEAKRMRARSRWESVITENKKNEGEAS
jgi:hypothetical protein